MVNYRFHKKLSNELLTRFYSLFLSWTLIYYSILNSNKSKFITKISFIASIVELQQYTCNVPFETVLLLLHVTIQNSKIHCCCCCYFLMYKNTYIYNQYVEIFNRSPFFCTLYVLFISGKDLDIPNGIWLIVRVQEIISSISQCATVNLVMYWFIHSFHLLIFFFIFFPQKKRIKVLFIRYRCIRLHE